jgi:hypothetical protein
MDNKVIKSVNYNQHAIIRDIMELHNNVEPFDVDPTYSIGNFYGKFKDGDETFEIPQPKYKFDVDPQVEGVEKLDPWGKWPLEDESVNSILFDPPFVIGPRDCASMFNGKKDSNIIGKRFSSYYPVAELLSSYKHHLEEAYRVLKDDGIIVFKCQDTTTGGKELRSSGWVWLCASALGFEVLDKFVLVTKQRLISGKVKKQQHARKYDSYFYVLKKNSKKNIRYFDFMEEKELNDFIDGLKNNWLSKKNKETIVKTPPVNADE